VRAWPECTLRLLQRTKPIGTLEMMAVVAAVAEAVAKSAVAVAVAVAIAAAEVVEATTRTCSSTNTSDCSRSSRMSEAEAMTGDW